MLGGTRDLCHWYVCIQLAVGLFLFYFLAVDVVVCYALAYLFMSELSFLRKMSLSDG